jgi:hypothetical protein
MTDYNDGSWHGWNGGECPVHPDSEVEAMYISASQIAVIHDKRRARRFVWDAPVSSVIAFRVTKPYREPRVIWVNEHEDGIFCAYGSEEEARENAIDPIRTAVRYVEAPE